MKKIYKKILFIEVLILFSFSFINYLVSSNVSSSELYSKIIKNKIKFFLKFKIKENNLKKEI